ncbi:hypothetical protein PsyrH_00595 [Pseudomonas syringae pv. syringae HS191]|nr:hypothetical protein PsyrH_00595 [Pseudomonas syringae pv. syringae HS191]
MRLRRIRPTAITRPHYWRHTTAGGHRRQRNAQSRRWPRHSRSGCGQCSVIRRRRRGHPERRRGCRHLRVYPAQRQLPQRCQWQLQPTDFNGNGHDMFDVSALGFTGLGNGYDGTLKVVLNLAGDATALKSLEADANGNRFEILLSGNHANELNASTEGNAVDLVN